MDMHEAMGLGDIKKLLLPDVSSEEQGSRMRKKQPDKNKGKRIKPEELVTEAFDEDKRSAWGMPGAYEVPELKGDR